MTTPEDRALEIRSPDFVAETAFEPAPRLSLSGSADTVIASSLVVLTDRLHARLRGTPAREVTVDLTRLEFMSAAALNAFVGWLAVAAEQAPSERYQIRFVANRDHAWQKRSLDHLAGFAPDVVVVEW